ncbi:BBE domain-containing protein [Nocardioides sp. YIM 152588]|uniref:BBE domain-containing protein n=1 Tax=Nocardioides sp. YIM 152588 TaxID=3158259 RepID=UPI0032E46269
MPNAVAGREGAYTLLALGVLAPGLEEVVPAACDAVAAAMRPWATGTALLNWLGASAGAEEVAGAWTPGVRDRLLAVKRAVDPGNVFRLGHALRA